MFASPDTATRSLYGLPAEQVMADLHAVAAYAAGIPAGNGKLAVAGFCWGGGQAFQFATQSPGLQAAFVFYGSFAHTPAVLARLACPVYGFYGEDDARINATVPATVAAVREAGGRFEAVTYAGAGHGFMRGGEEPTAAAPNRQRAPRPGSVGSTC